MKPPQPLTFVLFWAAVLALTIVNRAYVHPFQAFVRADTVPLAVVGLALSLEHVPVGGFAQTLPLTAGVALAVTQLAYFAFGPLFVELTLAAAVATGLFLNRSPVASRHKQETAQLVLALVVSECIFHYIDYPVHRLGPIPASALIVALRTLSSAVLFAGLMWAVAATRSTQVRLTANGVTTAAIVLVAGAQVAYFHFHLFPDPWHRVFLVSISLMAIGACAALVTRNVGTPSVALGDVNASGLFTLLCLQLLYS